MAFTCDPSYDQVAGQYTPQSSPPQENYRNRRKRSDRGKSQKELSSNKTQTGYYQSKPKKQEESEMKSVITMDQFANFLLKKSSYIESRSGSEQDPETYRKEYQNQDEPISEDFKRPSTQEDEQQDSVIQYNELQFNDETQLHDGGGNYSQEGGSARMLNNSSQRQKYKRDVKSSLSQNQTQVAATQKRTPQKYNQNNNQDYYEQLSNYMNGTPSAIIQRSQFSPTTPISIINNDNFGQMSPQNQREIKNKDSNSKECKKEEFNEYESNFALELEEENRSTQFKDTMKSHSTEVRSAVAELENINQKLLSKPSQPKIENSKVVNTGNNWSEDGYFSNGSHNPSHNQKQIEKKKSITQQLYNLPKNFEETKQNSLNTTQEYNMQQKSKEVEVENKQETNKEDLDRNFILQQYEYVLQQLNSQVSKLLARNQELEQTNISNEMIISQSKQCIQELKQQVQGEKSQGEQKVLDACNKIRDHLEGEIDKHKQVLTFYSQELELQRNISAELESRVQQFQQAQVSQKRRESELVQRYEEQAQKCQQLESLIKKKDEEVYKLRQDNQTLFADLKQLASSEESFKMDIIESKNKRVEMQLHIEELQDKIQHLESKNKNMGQEMEKSKREGQINLDQTRIMERNIDELKRENDSLKEKLTMMDQERQNLLSEKERRERDCKNMQADLNRFNAMIHAYKNLGGAQNIPQEFQGTVPNFQQNQRNQPGQQQQQQQQQQVQYWQKVFSQQLNQGNDRQVLKSSDVNQQPAQRNPFQNSNEAWMNQNNGSEQHRGQNSNGKYQDMSPLKKSDPNAPYIQRQKMMQSNVPYPTNNQNQNPQGNNQTKNSFVGGNVQNSNVQNLQATLQTLLMDKQRLESEYSKVPITINGKSMQIRKKKEELEFELDLVEKNINQVTMKIKEAQHSGF